MYTNDFWILRNFINFVHPDNSHSFLKQYFALFKQKIIIFDLKKSHIIELYDIQSNFGKYKI